MSQLYSTAGINISLASHTNHIWIYRGLSIPLARRVATAGTHHCEVEGPTREVSFYVEQPFGLKGTLCGVCGEYPSAAGFFASAIGAVTAYISTHLLSCI